MKIEHGVIRHNGILFQEGIEVFPDGASGEITRSKPGVNVLGEQ